MNTVRMGIVGFGKQGSTYAALIAAGTVPGMQLAAIAETDPDASASAADLYPDVQLFGDYRALLDSGEVDAVVTTVPHYLHPAVGMDALNRGIHVLVEKPAGVYTKQVAELNACAASHPDVTFAIMFNQRTNPLYQRIKQIVDSGEIGAIRHSSWIITTWWRPQGYYDQSAWRATWGGEGGGVLVNQAPHQLDLWQWICGVPVSVFSKLSYGFRRDIAVEDEVTVIADYGNGATGVFITATHDLDGTDRFEILGDAGKIVVHDSATAVITRLSRPEREISDTTSLAEVSSLVGGGGPSALLSRETLEFGSEWGAQHRDVLENFASHLIEGTPLIAPGRDGIMGVRLANAIHLSSWLEREVSLDFDEDQFLALLNDRIRDEGMFPEKK